MHRLAQMETGFRDAHDHPVLVTLLAVRATSATGCYLVTGDKDLLVLAGRYPVVTPAGFWQTHGGL